MDYLMKNLIEVSKWAVVIVLLGQLNTDRILNNIQTLKPVALMIKQTFNNIINANMITATMYNYLMYPYFFKQLFFCFVFMAHFIMLFVETKEENDIFKQLNNMMGSMLSGIGENDFNPSTFDFSKLDLETIKPNNDMPIKKSIFGNANILKGVSLEIDTDDDPLCFDSDEESEAEELEAEETEAEEPEVDEPEVLAEEKLEVKEDKPEKKRRGRRKKEDTKYTNERIGNKIKIVKKR